MNFATEAKSTRAVSVKRAQGQGASAEKAEEALGAELTALATEAAAVAIAAEKARLSQSGHVLMILMSRKATSIFLGASNAIAI